MKLHLPSGLRKALLACLAALAAHTLPFTVASGSALAASGAFAAFMLGQNVASADDEEVSMDEEREADYVFDQWDAFRTASERADAAGELWSVNLSSSGYIGSTRTIYADLRFEGDFTINNGSSGATITFAGDLYGDENVNLIFNWVGGGNVARGQEWKFTGNLTGFLGNIEIKGCQNEFESGTHKGKRFVLTFEGAHSNVGGIDVTPDKCWLYVNDAIMQNSLIRGLDTIEISGDSEFNVAKIDITNNIVINADSNVTFTQGTISYGNSLSMEENSHLLLYKGVTLIQTGGITNLITGTLEMEKGSTLNLQGGSFSLGSGVTLSITGSDSEPASIVIQNRAGMTMAQSILANLNPDDIMIYLNLAPDAYTSDGADLGEYLTFTKEGGEEFGENLIHFVSKKYMQRGWGLRIGEDGHLYLVDLQTGHDPADLSWNPNGANDVWDNGDSANWIASGVRDITFASNDNVIFDADQGEEVEIAPDGVRAGNMTVRNGTWGFSGGDLEVTGNLVVQGGEVCFSGETSIAASNGLVIGVEEETASAKVIIATSGSRNFGDAGITVHEGAEFVLRTEYGWINVDGHQISGNGSLVFEGLNLQWNNGEAGNIQSDLLYSFLSQGGTNTLKRLELRTNEETGIGTVFCVASVNNADSLKRIDEIVVQEDSTLQIGSAGLATVRTEPGKSNTIYISGEGHDGAGAIESIAGVTVAWDIKVDGSATINCGGNITLTGQLRGDDVTLTTKGSARVLLGSGFSGVNGSGMLKVENAIWCQLDGTQADVLKNWDIYLTGAGNDLYLSSNRSTTLTLHSLQGGAGSVVQGSSSTVNGSEHYELIVDYDGAKEAVWGGKFESGGNTSGTTADTWIIFEKKGSGTQVFTANQAKLHSVTVSGGTLELRAGGKIGATFSNTTNATNDPCRLILKGGATLCLGGTLDLTTNVSSALEETTEKNALISISVESFVGSSNAVFSVGDNSNALGMFTTGLKIQLDKQLKMGQSIQLISGGALTTDILATIRGLVDDELSGLGERFHYDLSDTGVLSLAMDTVDVTWNGGVEDRRWEAAGEGWLNGDGEADLFGSASDVTFTADLAENGEVTIEAGVSAGTVTVEGGAWSWTQEGEFSMGKLVVKAGSLNIVGEEQSTTFGGDIALGTEATVGELSVSAGQIILTDGSVISGSVVGEDESREVSSARFEASTSFTWTGTLSVEDGAEVTFGGAGTITAGTLSIGEGSVVSVSAVGTKNFAGVTLAEGGQLILDSIAVTSWNATNKISGEGTLTLRGLGAMAQGDFARFWSSDNSLKLGSLVLEEGTYINMTSEGSNGAIGLQLANLGEIHVRDGSSLMSNAVNSIGKAGAAGTLYLSGNGVKDAEVAGGGTAAFIVANLCGTGSSPKYTGVFRWNVTLEDDASIWVGNAGGTSGSLRTTLTLTGEYTGGGHTLTIIGGDTLVLGATTTNQIGNTTETLDTPYQFHTAKDSTGKFYIKSGTLSLAYTEGQDTALAKYDVELGGGTLSLASDDYTIQSLQGDSGNVTAEDEATLTINYNGAEAVSTSAVFDSNVSIVKKGSGTQKMTQSAWAGGSVSVAEGTLEFTKGLALGTVNVTGGTLKLSNSGASVTGTLTVDSGDLDIVDGVSLGTLHLVDHGTDGVLSISNDVSFINLKVDSGKNLTLSGDDTVSSALVASNLSGTLTVDSSELTLSAGGALGGTLALKNGGTVKLGADLDISDATALSFAGENSGFVTNASGTTRYLVYSGGGSMHDLSAAKFTGVGIKITGAGTNLDDPNNGRHMSANTVIDTDVWVTGNSALDFNGVTGSSITGTVSVDNGSIVTLRNNADATLNALSGEGTLNVYKAKVTLTEGGSISNLNIGWGTADATITKLTLGDDLTVQQVSFLGNAGTKATIASSAEDGSNLVFKATGSTFSARFDDLSFDGVSIEVVADGTTTHGALGVTGSGMIGTDVTLNGGSLDLSALGNGTDGAGISGTLTVNTGTLTLRDGLKIGTLHVVDASDYTASDGALVQNTLRIVDDVTIGTAKVNSGKTLRFQDAEDGNYSGAWTIENALEAAKMAGGLNVWHHVLTLTKGGTMGGALQVAWGGTLNLGADLTVGSELELSGGSHFTSMDASGGTEGTTNRDLIFTGTKTLTSGVNNATFSHVGLRVSGEDSVLSVADGTTKIGTWVKIDEGTTLAFSTTGNTTTIEGAVTGAGTLKVTNSAGVTLSAQSAVGELNQQSGGAVLLKNGVELTAHRLTSAGEGSVSIGKTEDAASASFVLDLAAADEADYGNFGSAKLTVGKGVTFEKKGTGTQRFTHLETAEDVLISAGALQADSSDFVVGGDLRVAAEAGADSAAFFVNVYRWEAPEMNITLGGKGGIKWVYTQNTNQQESETRFGTLTVVGTGNTLDMGPQTVGHMTAIFGKLTSAAGAGNTLDVGTLAGRNEYVYESIYFETVENFNGTLTGSTGSANPRNRVRIGHVHQDSGVSGVLDIAGSTGVFSTDFRKTGEGSLSITHLTVGAAADAARGRLYMEYEGALTVGRLTVQGDVTLVYTTGTESNLLTVGAADVLGSLGSGDRLTLDVTSVSASRLQEGICLGLTGKFGPENLADLKNLFTLEGINDANSVWSLEWRGGMGSETLWLVLENAVVDDSKWDENWGSGAVGAPEWDEMPVFARQLGSQASDHVVELGKEDWGGEVRLQAGSGGKYATVLGGVMHTEADTLGWDNGATWILMDGGNYHILAGGSSCLVEAADTDTTGEIAPAGGHSGASHIEMHGGVVDYIVGGNHVNNSSFTFEGNSYISVFDGDGVNVVGGIVGGSTLTRGSASSSVYAFLGDSHIFVYTALTNAADTPAIWDGTESISGGSTEGMTTGAAFTAIVGGNAWIDRPASSEGAAMNPAFVGDSNIIINLSAYDATHGGEFHKEIVGGNYTATTLGSDTRNSTFDGSSKITIFGQDANGKEIVFTGGVSGASRRASGSGGNTEFTGDTSIRIAGGTYRQAIAGGFWFEETATGDHAATLGGSTEVSITSGNVWRVVGGSYSLAGGGNSGETQIGDALVRISGGNFSSEHGGQNASGQMSLGFVAGGSFYRSTGGDAHTMAGNTRVEITGGVFDSVHIVGGDYANFSGVGVDAAAGETAVARIDKEASVSISDAQVRGLVIGGSYMTDTSVGGEVSVGSTSVTIGSGAVLNHDDGHANHNGIAIVAGNVLIDESGAGAGTGAYDHSALVVGGTHIRVEGDAEITGHLVGGSYSCDNAGRNLLSIGGSVEIELAGGSINGNVYGGHYSENATTPDMLELNDVRIVVQGTANIEGNLVGGSRREVAVADATQTSATQGSITVKLVSGSLEGNVYAAGENASVGQGGDYKVGTETEATTVEVGAGFVFADNAIVSGGYLRASAAKDESIVKNSTLVFNESGYSNLEDVVWRDFHSVEVTEAGVSVTLDSLEIGHGTQTVGQAGSLRKTGSGELVLSKLTQDGKAGFAGQIWVAGGVLRLTQQQSLDGGLGFTLGESSNNAETAYLQGSDFTLTNGASIGLSFGYKAGEALPQLGRGRYYLVSGLESLLGGLSAEAWKSKFDLTEFDALADAVYASDNGYEMSLQLEDGDALVLTIRMKRNSSEWYWEGDSSENGGQDMVWRGNSASNWNQDDMTPGDVPNVNFDEAGRQGTVKVGNGVVVENVWVQGGSYTFAALENEYEAADGLEVRGKLIVGGSTSPVAELGLDLATKSVPLVDLREGGRLTLNHDKALQQGSTKILFDGGTLAWGETSGGLLGSSYRLEQETAAVAADAVLSVQVGKRWDELLKAEAVSTFAAVNEQTVTLGGANATPGMVTVGEGATAQELNDVLKAALEQGVRKTGRYSFSIEWAASVGTTIVGRSEALGGTLEYRLHGLAGQKYVFDGDPFVIAKGGVLSLTIEDNGVMEIARSFASREGEKGADEWFGRQDAQAEARAIIGSDIGRLAAVGTAPYTLSADNSGFDGVIQLLGGGSRELVDRVNVVAVNALGGEKTTLELSGRDIVFGAGVVAGADGYVSVGVKELRVTEGKTTYIGGGYAPLDVNRAVALSADAVTGQGVLANAKGGFHHTLAGDLSGFYGTLVAGAAVTTGDEHTSDWTLVGAAPKSKMLNTNLAGTGTIRLSYAGQSGLQLWGAIGGNAEQGNSISVENAVAGTTIVIAGANNTSTGELIFHSNEIHLGNVSKAANWAGAVLTDGDAAAGGEESRFVLVNGRLDQAMTTEGKGDVLLTVDARGVVYAGGTDGQTFDDIVVNSGAKLRDVSGVITAGSAAEGGVRVKLVIDEANMSDTAGTGEDALIGMRPGGKLDVKQAGTGEGLQLDFSGEGLVDILANHREQDYKTYLHLLTGGTLNFAAGLADENVLSFITAAGGYGQLLVDLGFVSAGVQGGDLVIAGSSKDVYLVLNEWQGEDDAKSRAHTVDTYGILGAYKATVLDKGTTLTLQLGDMPSSFESDLPTSSSDYQKREKAFNTDVAHGGMTVNNLVGLAGTTFVAEKAAGVQGDVKVVLNNRRITDADLTDGSDILGQPGVDHMDPPAPSEDELLGQDTQFKGTVIGKAGVNFEKIGAGALIVGDASTGQGGIQLQGDMTLSDGGLSITGSRTSYMRSLVFADDVASGKDGLSVTDGAALTVNSLKEQDSARGSVILEREGELILTGQSSLENTYFRSVDGSGKLTLSQSEEKASHGGLTLSTKDAGVDNLELSLEEGTSLSLKSGATISDSNIAVGAGSALTLEDSGSAIAGDSNVQLDGTLSLDDNSVLNTTGSLTQSHSGVLDISNSVGNSVGHFEGSGTLKGSGKGTLAVNGAGNSFTGKLTGAGNRTAGSLIVNEDAELALKNVQTDTDKNLWGLEVYGALTVDVADGTRANVNFSEIYLGDGSSLTYHISTENNSRMNGSIVLEDGGEADFIISAVGDAVDGDGLYLGHLVFEGGNMDLQNRLHLHLLGDAFLHFDGEWEIVDDYLRVKLTGATNNKFANANMEKNPKAGADFFWAATTPGSAAYKYMRENPDGDLARFTSELTLAMQLGYGATGGLDKALAAGVGASVSTLGSAVDEDIRRQLSSVRNRASLLTSDTEGVTKLMGSHVWINGETAYHKVNADGFAPGYTLNGWGGSVGVDAEINAETNVGLAITAMYNDLKTSAADTATGDVDTAYLSGFLRVAKGAWTHTLVAAVGTVDVTLNRTVQSPLGYSYSTQGNTDGYALGFMYEVGYSYMVNRQGTFAVQPVANIQVRHTALNAYKENGSDAALRVDGITQDVVTLGLGARVQGIVAENAFNRAAIFEARALVKADVGDRSSEAVTRLLHSEDRARVESAEVGAVGIEIGAGLTVPLGKSAGSIFIDASAEFRSGYSSVDASAGYRISF